MQRKSSTNELDDKTIPRTKSKRVTSTLGTKTQTKKTVDDYKKKQQRKLELKMMKDLSAIAQRCLKGCIKGWMKRTNNNNKTTANIK